MHNSIHNKTVHKFIGAYRLLVILCQRNYSSNSGSLCCVALWRPCYPSMARQFDDVQSHCYSH